MKGIDSMAKSIKELADYSIYNFINDRYNHVNKNWQKFLKDNPETNILEYSFMQFVLEHHPEVFKEWNEYTNS